MNNLEYEAVIECEKIKGKAAIAVAILSNCGGHGVMDLSELSRDNLLKYIKEVQATLDE
ncbi:hypothetical protein ACOULM_19445 [Acinetobacter baumannii]|nr:hypothetical protein [Acinetobacter baumannii]MCF4149151.1 hypothetical protein [Acinetobacter baumannii]MCF4206659.1 hypothetical protein [Acinetobacter baumannii]MCF4576957.1 hypothetical protein [Acinetobacter baumannii]MCT2432881.1 hypothetical protein [Acinetobacter baumannii]MDF7849060.1 hypothetical protein [Acinetobacter baumannii]